jgi:hypothetical protein
LSGHTKFLKLFTFTFQKNALNFQIMGSIEFFLNNNFWEQNMDMGQTPDHHLEGVSSSHNLWISIPASQYRIP